MFLKLRLYMLLLLMFAIVYGLVIAISQYLGFGNFVFYAIFTVLIITVQYMVGPKLVEFAMRVRYVTKEDEPKLYKIVEDMAKKAKIKTPKIGISEMQLANAFAFGKSKNDSRVCVTRGLLDILDEKELKAVIGHEISHIKNRDVMVITLLSVIPMICWYIAWSFMFSRSSRGNNALLGLGAFVLYFITNLLVLYGSRIREFYADRGSVELGNNPHYLATALYKLVQSSSRYNPQQLKAVEGYKAFFVNDPSTSRSEINEIRQVDKNFDGKINKDELKDMKNVKIELRRADKIMEVFSTHPNMLRRIKYLSSLEKK